MSELMGPKVSAPRSRSVDQGRAFTKPIKQGFASVGKPDMRVHDLRHVGATLAAQAGATTKELMARIGHTTPAMAMRYQIAAQERDAVIAERLSELAGALG